LFVKKLLSEISLIFQINLRCSAIAEAAEDGHLEIVELLMKDPRVNPADDMEGKNIIITRRIMSNNP